MGYKRVLFHGVKLGGLWMPVALWIFVMKSVPITSVTVKKILSMTIIFLVFIVTPHFYFFVKVSNKEKTQKGSIMGCHYKVLCFFTGYR